jgi:large subunit ribosomal protein L13
VVVINARHAVLTGNKADQKLYRWHTGWAGGLREMAHNKFASLHPTGVSL